MVVIYKSHDTAEIGQMGFFLNFNYFLFCKGHIKLSSWVYVASMFLFKGHICLYYTHGRASETGAEQVDFRGDGQH